MPPMEPEPGDGDLPDWVIVDISRPAPALSPSAPVIAPSSGRRAAPVASPAGSGASSAAAVLPVEWRNRLGKAGVLSDLLKMSSSRWTSESGLSPADIAQLEVFVEWLNKFVAEAAVGSVGAPKEGIEKICEFQILAYLHSDLISEAPACRIKGIFLNILKIPLCVPKLESEAVESEAREEFDSYFYDDQVVLKKPVIEGFWIDYGFYEPKKKEKEAPVSEFKVPIAIGDVRAKTTRKVENVMEPEESKESKLIISKEDSVASKKTVDTRKVVPPVVAPSKALESRKSAEKGVQEVVLKSESKDLKDTPKDVSVHDKEAAKILAPKSSSEGFEKKIEVESSRSKVSAEALDDKKASKDSSSKDRGELQEKMLHIVGLALRDWLGNGQDSPLLMFLNNFIEEILLSVIPKDFEEAEKTAVVEKDKILALDFRVIIIKRLEELSQDYLSVLKTFQSSKKIYQDTKPKTPEKSLDIIKGLIKAIEVRGSYSVFEEFKYSKDFTDVKDFEDKIGKIESELITKICRKVVILLKPDPKVASALEKLFEQALSALISHSSTNSAFWLMVFHKIPHMDLPPFPEAPKVGATSPTKSSKDHSFAVDLGSEVVHLMSNLIDLANPQGMAGFLASVGKQIMKTYVERVGKALVQELRTPVSWRRILWSCELMKGLLWNPNGAGDFVFLTQISMYKKVKEDVESSKTADIEEAVIHELAELIYGKVLDSVPKKLGFIKGSMKSVHMAIWWLIRLLVDITQSPLVMRYVVVQYILKPASQM